MGLNGHRVDTMKRTLLDFSFSLSKTQKIVAVEELQNEKEVSEEEDGQEVEDVLLGASVSVLPV